MRLLHTLNHLSNRGNGIINLAIDLAVEQRALGHTVAFICGGGGHEATLERYGIQHYPLYQSRSFTSTPFGLLKMRRTIRDFRPDLIHSHMRSGLLFAWPWAKLGRIPIVAHLHNVHDRESLLMRIADRILAVSEAVKIDMERQGIPAAKLRVVLNGTLDSPRLPPFASITPQPLEHPAIVTVAGLNERKGIRELIQAFASIANEFRDAHLYLVGDGPGRAEFEQQAQALPFADRIHFAGFQSSPASWMRAADIFVLASRRESFGLVLTEARQAGCAIIATNVDGIPEALDQGKAGILIPPQDPGILANTMRTLLRNPSLAESYRAAAKQNLQRFTTRAMAQEVEKVYAALIKAK